MVNENKEEMKKLFLFFVTIALCVQLSGQSAAPSCPFDTILPTGFKQSWTAAPLKKALGDYDYPMRSNYKDLLDRMFQWYIVSDTVADNYQYPGTIKSKNVSKKCIMNYFGKPDRRRKNTSNDTEHWIYYFNVEYDRKKNKRPILSKFFGFVFEKNSQIAYRVYFGFDGE